VRRLLLRASSAAVSCSWELAETGDDQPAGMLRWMQQSATGSAAAVRGGASGRAISRARRCFRWRRKRAVEIGDAILQRRVAGLRDGAAILTHEPGLPRRQLAGDRHQPVHRLSAFRPSRRINGAVIDHAGGDHAGRSDKSRAKPDNQGRPDGPEMPSPPAPEYAPRSPRTLHGCR